MKPLHILFVLFVGALFTGCPTTQEATQGSQYSDRKELIPNDYVYDGDIKTVQFYRGENEVSYPIIFLDINVPLTLEFDELLPEDQRESDFFVDIVSCDANWQPTTVLPIEFYEGFTQDRIDLFRRSEFTKIPYVHYTYQFPQENEAFKMSGNYILKVFRSGNTDDLIITKRFIVADRKVKIESKYVLGNLTSRLELSEFGFDVFTPGLRIMNPTTDLKVKMLQNFRWDNAYAFSQPRFYGDNQFEYQVDLTQAFRGGNEFRYHDARSMRLYSESMQDVEEQEDIYDVFLFMDEPLRGNRIRSQRDLNGSYFINVQEWPSPDIQADYVRNNFFLKSPYPIEDGGVYIFGRFSDWQAKPDFRMNYNEAQRRYEGSAILKQGVYDYMYAVQRTGDPVVDEATFQGPHKLSENFYTVLVYYRGPVDRTDQLIGYFPINYSD